MASLRNIHSTDTAGMYGNDAFDCTLTNLEKQLTTLVTD